MKDTESLAEIQRDLERFSRDGEYVQRHRAELLSQYPDMWIGVYEQKLVGAATTIGELIRQIEDKGLAPGYVYRQYLATKEEDLIVVVGPT